MLGSDLTKGSEGEQACLVCYDDYTGCVRLSTDVKDDRCKHIVPAEIWGTKAHGKALCTVKSDCASELVEAMKFLGWLPEPGIPNDPFHNAKLESNMRRIKGRGQSRALGSWFSS